ncbi:MAG: DUF3306 domain-containing protein [Burkholderiales bacterium]
MGEQADGFLSRWSRRKEQARGGAEPAPPPAVDPPVPPAPPLELPPDVPPPAPVTEPPAPTMADVAALSRDSDYARFVAGNVDVDVKRAAMKKLFSDPHFNVMDGLDTYIDDYGKPDPIPMAMLRQLNQSTLLRLFETDDEPATTDVVATAPAPALDTEPTHDDPDLRLQQDDDAGRGGPDEGTRA